MAVLGTLVRICHRPNREQPPPKRTQRWQRATKKVGRGHFHQGRFKSFPVETDKRFYTRSRSKRHRSLHPARPPLRKRRLGAAHVGVTRPGVHAPTAWPPQGHRKMIRPRNCPIYAPDPLYVRAVCRTDAFKGRRRSHFWCVRWARPHTTRRGVGSGEVSPVRFRDESASPDRSCSVDLTQARAYTDVKPAAVMTHHPRRHLSHSAYRDSRGGVRSPTPRAE